VEAKTKVTYGSCGRPLVRDAGPGLTQVRTGQPQHDFIAMRHSRPGSCRTT